MFLDLVQLLAAAAWMKRTTALRGLLAACLADPTSCKNQKPKQEDKTKNLQGETPGYLELRLPLGLALLVPLTLATGAA